MSARNAEPETVALAVLDACERASRGCAPDYTDVRDEDAQFMKRSIESIKSRLRVLKRQAAAQWSPQFTSMLEQCHSIAVERVDYDEKEGVRTDKMKCMACGRWEHCCKYALNAVGPFEHAAFNVTPVDNLSRAWAHFYQGYRSMCDDAFVDYTRRNHLPDQDMGEYTIGSTCLRKAELYYLANTMMLECCYDAAEEARQAQGPLAIQQHSGPFKWYYATEKQAGAFLKKLEDLELAIADEKRAVPDWGVDENMWWYVQKARKKAAGGDEEERVHLLRRRAEKILATELSSDDGSEEDEEEEQEDHCAEVSEEESADDSQCCQPRRRNLRVPRRNARRVLDSDDEWHEEHEEACAPMPSKGQLGKKRKQKAGVAPTRQSRRQRKLSPEDEASFACGPRNEGREVTFVEEASPPVSKCAGRGPGKGDEEGTEEDEEDEEGFIDPDEAIAQSEKDVRSERMAAFPECFSDSERSSSRRPGPNAAGMAQEQRMPGARLPARRSALINLGALQLRLLREGKDDDAAICTNAMFTIQDLLARVSQLAHTV